MIVERYENNPIITAEQIMPSRSGLEVVAALNPGVTKFNGKTLLFIRVAERPPQEGKVLKVPVCGVCGYGMMEFDLEDNSIDFSDSRLVIKNGNRYLTTMSHFLPALSEDGIHFKFDYEGSLCAGRDVEAYGIEDSRITEIDGVYYITYASASALGVCTTLVKTLDFKKYDSMGVILTSDNKDVALFPQKINGKYYMIHRPSTSEFGKPEIWIAESPDLYHWGNHRHVMGLREGMWDSTRIGSSSIPIYTKQGWFMVYHGADKKNRYCLGACLMALDDPSKLIARTVKPFMEPRTPYETSGFFGEVVFSCGCVEENGIIKIYYGAADKCICLASADINEIITGMEWF